MFTVLYRKVDFFILKRIKEFQISIETYQKNNLINGQIDTHSRYYKVGFIKCIEFQFFQFWMYFLTQKYNKLAMSKI